jgi:hypothetical protein
VHQKDNFEVHSKNALINANKNIECLILRTNIFSQKLLEEID